MTESPPWMRTAYSQPSVVEGSIERFIVTIEFTSGERFSREASYANWHRFDYWTHSRVNVPNCEVEDKASVNYTEAVVVRGWLVCSEDRHDLEYIPLQAEVIAWIPFPTPMRDFGSGS